MSPTDNTALKADGHAPCLRKGRARGLRQRYPDEKNQADHVRLGTEEGALLDRRNVSRRDGGDRGERMAKRIDDRKGELRYERRLGRCIQIRRLAVWGPPFTSEVHGGAPSPHVDQL